MNLDHLCRLKLTKVRQDEIAKLKVRHRVRPLLEKSYINNTEQTLTDKEQEAPGFHRKNRSR